MSSRRLDWCASCAGCTRRRVPPPPRSLRRSCSRNPSGDPLSCARAADLLAASLTRDNPRYRDDNVVTVAITQDPKRHDRQDGDDTDDLLAIDALRLLALESNAKASMIVGSVVAACERGTYETKRALLRLLSELSASPLSTADKTVMTEARVVALCVDVLNHPNHQDSWQLAIAILGNLNTSSHVALDADEASDGEEVDGDSEDEKPSDGDEILIQTLQQDGEDLRALLAQRAWWDTEDTSSDLVTKLKKMQQVVSRHKTTRRAGGNLIHVFIQIQEDGREDEQLAAARLINTLIEEYPSNALAVVRADGVHAVLRLFSSHSDVLAVVNQVERFVYRIHAVRAEEARAATRSLLTGLLRIAQDPEKDQAAVAIELLTLLSATHSLLATLVDAGAIRVCCQALDQIRQRLEYAGSIQLRHITAIVLRIAKEYKYCGKLINDGVLENLIAVLKRAPQGLRSDMAMTLSQIATYSPAKHAIGSSGCLNVFVDMLCNSTESEQAAGADALASACADCDANVARIRYADVVHKCLEVVGDKKSMGTYDAALGLLAVLATSPTARASVVSDMMPLIALAMLRNGTHRTQRLGAVVVEALAQDRAMCLEMTRLEVRAILPIVSGDASVSAAVGAARRVLAEYGLEHARHGNEWVTEVSRTHGRTYYVNVLTGKTEWREPSTSQLTDVTLLFTEPKFDGDPDLADQLLAAGGVPSLLKALEDADHHGLSGEPILHLLHQLARRSEETKRTLSCHLKFFSRWLSVGSTAERHTAAHAIVDIFEPTHWLQDDQTSKAVGEAFVRDFVTVESSSTAVHSAMQFVSILQGSDSIEADAARATLFRGLLDSAKANTTSRSTLAVRLVLTWCKDVELAFALMDAGVGAVGVSVLEQAVCVLENADLTVPIASPRSGAIHLTDALDMAQAMATAEVSEKLVEEGAIDVLMSLFETLHRPLFCEELKRQRMASVNMNSASLNVQTPTDNTTMTWLTRVINRVPYLLYQLARRHPHTRPSIGASACMPILVESIIKTRESLSTEIPRTDYAKLLATLCLDCPENVRRVSHTAVINACEGMLTDTLEVESALRLVASLASEETAGAFMAENTVLVDAVMVALRKECQEYRNKSPTRWRATHAVGVLVRYAPCRARLINAGVVRVLNGDGQHSVIHREMKKALHLLRWEERVAREIARQMVEESEHDGFYMVDVDDLDGASTNHLAAVLITAIRAASSDRGRVDAVRAVNTFIDGSAKRAVAAINAGYANVVLRLYTTTMETDKAARSAIQKCVHELHNTHKPSKIAQEAVAQLVRGLFAFAASNGSKRAKLAVQSLTTWVANGTFQRVFEASGIAASCVERIKRICTEDVETGGLQLTDMELLLAWMTQSSELARDTVIDDGLVPILLARLPERPRGARAKLLSILHDVAYNDATARPQFATHFGTLLTIVRHGTSGERERAMMVFAGACTECPQNAMCVPHDELLDLATLMLDRYLSAEQCAALRLIESFCRDAVTGPKTVSRVELVALVGKRLSRTPPSMQAKAAKVVALLATHDQSRTQLIAACVEDVLQAMTEPSVRPDAEAALQALRIGRLDS